MNTNDRRIAEGLSSPRVRLLSRLSAALCFAGLWGCRAIPDTPEGLVRIDSAGVEIVSLSADDLKPLDWSMAEEPILQVGAVDGEEIVQFQRISHAGMLNDSVLLVVEAGSAQLRFFTASGEPISSTGTRGQGPGEFMLPTFAGYSVWDDEHAATIFDSRNRKISTVTPGAGIVDEIPVAPEPVFVELRTLVDGTFLGRVFTAGPRLDENGAPVLETGVFRNEQPIHRLTVDGASPDPIATLLSAPERRSPAATPGAIQITPTLLGTPPLWTAGLDRIHLADEPRFEIRTRSASGELLRILRIETASSPVREADLDTEIAGRLSRMPVEVREGMEIVLRRSPVADSLPHIRSLSTDRSGHLWARRWSPTPTGDIDWVVIDSTGAPIGTFSTPGSLEVTEIGEDYIVGVWTDEFDVPYVRMYALERR